MGGRGSGGHNRKSVWEHTIDGTYRESRHGPKPEANQLEMPPDIKPSDWLSTEAKAYFKELAPQLWKLGTLDRLGLRLFEALCLTLAERDTLKQILDAEGEVVNGKVHLLNRIYNQCINEILKLFRIFGMTPAARQRLGIGKIADEH